MTRYIENVLSLAMMRTSLVISNNKPVLWSIGNGATHPTVITSVTTCPRIDYPQKKRDYE